MPRESYAWRVAHRNLVPFGTLTRIENRLASGFPDVIYCLKRVTGLLEMKATVESLTLAQVLYAETWTEHGGLWHMMLHADRTWFLLDAAGARRALERKEPEPVVRIEGSFPVREILRCLAPRQTDVGRVW